MKAICSILVFVFCTLTAGADDLPKKPHLIQGTPAQQMEAIKLQYQAAQKASNESLIESPPSDFQVKAPIQGRTTIIEGRFDSDAYFGMMLKIAKDHTHNPARLDGLNWVFLHGPQNWKAQAAELIMRDHLMDPQIGTFCEQTTFWLEGLVETANALRIVNAKHANREVRAIAGYFLAEQLMFGMVEKARVASEANAKDRWKYKNWFDSPAEEEKYRMLNPDELEKEACRLFKAIIADPVGSNIVHPYCKDAGWTQKKLGRVD